MKLLDNELVRKYFGNCDQHIGCLSLHVLQAMQQPIRKWERYLYCSHEEPFTCEEMQWGEDHALGIYGFHPFHLRLPDRFQKKECEFVKWEHFKDLEQSLMNRVSEISSRLAGHLDAHPKPAPEPLRCVCGWSGPEGHIHICKDNPEPEKFMPTVDHACDNYSVLGGCGCKPSSAVEEKINEIMDSKLYGHTFRNLDLTIRKGTGLEYQLRALVKLAQKEKGA